MFLEYHNMFTQLQKAQCAEVVSQYESLRERIHRSLSIRHHRPHAVIFGANNDIH